MTPEPAHRAVVRYAISGIAICFLAWAAVFIYRSSFVAMDGKRYFCLFDDAMVSMRYAWNLAHGQGLVWNPGERVEGYTNFLMTLMMSVPASVFDKSTAVLAIQVAGIGILLCNALVVMKIVALHTERTECRILAFFLALSYYPLTFWTLMGMETGLLALLMTLSVLAAMRYAREGTASQGILLSILLGLAYLTRPDSFLFAAVIFIFLIQEKHKLGKLARIAGLYACFLAGHELFRWYYYHELAPNTYTLKVTGIPLITRVRNGLGSIPLLFKQASVILILAGIGVFSRFSREKLLLIVPAVLLIGYQVSVGGDVWGSYWRMVTPAMPLVFIAGTYGIFEIAAFFAKAARAPFLNQLIHYGSIGVLALLGLLPLNYEFWRQIAFLTRPYSMEANQANVNTAIAINSVTTPEATIAVFWAGSIPYFADRVAVDILGKSDPHIAKLPPRFGSNGRYLPGHNKYDLNYSIKERLPTYVQYLTWDRQDLSEWARSKYVSVQYRGVSLTLLRDSPAVLWNNVK